jgi:DNA-binding NarL/FixJ family response regulator
MRSSQPLHAIRVLVADSSAIHSELLAESIGRDRRFTVIACASSSGEIQSLLRDSCPDVLLISASIDEQTHGGLHLLAELRASHPEIKAVVLLESPKRETVVQAFRVGARGVFSKKSPFKLLGKCLDCVHLGQVWATTEELGFVLQALADSPVRPLGSISLSQLSVRELDVVTCLAEGLSNAEIAQRLNLSRHTVKNYMFRVFDKLGVSSRVELLFHVLSRPPSELKGAYNGGKPASLPLQICRQVKDKKEDAVSERRSQKRAAVRGHKTPSDESALLSVLGKLIVATERRADAAAAGADMKNSDGKDPATGSPPSRLLARLASSA